VKRSSVATAFKPVGLHGLYNDRVAVDHRSGDDQCSIAAVMSLVARAFDEATALLSRPVWNDWFNAEGFEVAEDGLDLYGHGYNSPVLPLTAIVFTYLPDLQEVTFL
jgi:hypothetical protein